MNDKIKYSATYAKLHPRNCAIIEYTADGESVGPCTFFLQDGVCPRHGEPALALGKEINGVRNERKKP